MKSFSKVSLCVSLAMLGTITFPGWASEHSGETTFIQNCMVCHDHDGTGSLPGTPDLNEDRRWQKRPDNELVDQLVKGIDARNGFIGMPAKGGNPDLSIEQLRGALRYLRTITKD